MLQEAASTVETHHPGRHLGSDAELDLEPLGEMAATPTDLSGYRSYLRRAPTGDQLAPRPNQRGGQLRLVAQSMGEHLVEDAETLGPGANTTQALSQFSSSTAHDVIEPDDQRGQLTRADAEHGTGTQRR